jgi:hypothetical protein
VKKTGRLNRRHREADFRPERRDDQLLAAGLLHLVDDSGVLPVLTLAAWSALISVTKNRLLSIPSKVAVVLASVKTPAQVMEILRREISEALQELADAQVIASKPGRPKRDAA